MAERMRKGRCAVCRSNPSVTACRSNLCVRSRCRPIFRADRCAILRDEQTSTQSDLDELKKAAEKQLGSLVATLLLPLPIVAAMVFTVLGTRGGHPITAVTFVGLDVPFSIAGLSAMTVNAVLLLHVARMTMLLIDSRDVANTMGELASFRRTLERSAGLFNPFSSTRTGGSKTRGRVSKVLHRIPQAEVGFLLGMHFSIIIGNSSIKAQLGDYALGIIFMIAILHVVANVSALIGIVVLSNKLSGWIAPTIVLAFWLIGAVVGNSLATELNYDVKHHVAPTLTSAIRKR